MQLLQQFCHSWRSHGWLPGVFRRPLWRKVHLKQRSGISVCGRAAPSGRRFNAVLPFELVTGDVTRSTSGCILEAVVTQNSSQTARSGSPSGRRINGVFLQVVSADRPEELSRSIYVNRWCSRARNGFSCWWCPLSWFFFDPNSALRFRYIEFLLAAGYEQDLTIEETTGSDHRRNWSSHIFQSVLY